MFEIKPYTKEYAAEWNRFVEHSRQGTFLFNRGYMDYHHDRFSDCSLMVMKKGHLCALLPANSKDSTLYSHQGLTYGGLLTDQKAKATDVMEMFESINKWLQANDFNHVVYKAIPWIYQRVPADEDLYALTQVCHSHLTVREISSTILLKDRMKFEESRKSGIRKAQRYGIECRECDDLADFWQILNNNLESKYHKSPVHTLEELQLLHSRFPDKIRLYMAYKDSLSLGGTLIFDTGKVIHTQYISASPEGKEEGALDLLFDYIINKVYADRCILDFGKSTEDNGRRLNRNLIFQKEGFGGRGVCYDTYEYDL
ncbi:MAG: GNAT family N-acetyltransferase [Prevotella sp.]|jgi:hypothetical protein